MKYHIGFHKAYIKDHRGFKHLVDIPTEAALAWIKRIMPTFTFDGKTQVKDMTLEDLEKGEIWGNKVFIIMDFDHDKLIAINNYDCHYSIYVKQYGPEDLKDED